ncbi:SDR family oxidoreductase [Lampropedia puyangensis]|uniref:SDR family oxidoreductase n=1 Tax=Lampropedia puyangensis TaxID=1330072 RepID=A0A4S8FD00_9BURK|nr:SDR family oxidoreductase [Lampropedia puyangensis]THU05179.1 SDR family oxidoreductase [Lampropedia puyangensis]
MNTSATSANAATAIQATKHDRPLVFITGASSGLGQALAEEYAKQGWRLALVARRLDVMQQWREQHGLSTQQCHLYAADVAQPSSIRAVAEQCIQEQGLPDVVIASAGISHGIDTADWEDLAPFEQIWATNNRGLAATFIPFMAGMRARKSGVLVGIASVAGVRGLPGHAGYCSSKAGVIAYCESLRGDLRGTGVDVVTISPGFVRTAMTAKNPFSMPFLIDAQVFAAKAFAAIARRTSYVVIPWQMAWVERLLRILPNAVFDWALAGRGRKPRHKPDV